MQPHTSTAVRLLCVALLCLVVLVPGTALAHEHRTSANSKYDLTVGWESEPTYAGLKNSAGIRIMAAGTQDPIEGADKSLKLQVRQGASTKDLALHAVFGQPGYYTADFIPTREGDYRWIFTGNINGDAVNETFDTADGKIDSVQPQAALQFPAAQADPAVQAAQADAQSARSLAYVAIGIGILGVLAGALAWLSRARTQAVTAAGRPAGERI